MYNYERFVMLSCIASHNLIVTLSHIFIEQLILSPRTQHTALNRHSVIKPTTKNNAKITMSCCFPVMSQRRFKSMTM